MSTITLAEHKLLPDSVVRFGIKKLLKQRLQVESANDPEQREKRHQQLLEHLRQSPIAIETAAANAQHY
jgi:cyclopropane-fatty-acyl-phospholipid synthase